MNTFTGAPLSHRRHLYGVPRDAWGQPNRLALFSYPHVDNHGLLHKLLSLTENPTRETMAPRLPNSSTGLPDRIFKVYGGNGCPGRRMADMSAPLPDHRPLTT